MIRLLIVEDSPTVREFLTELFRNDGEVEIVGIAINGQEALVEVQKLKPDVVLMDINMPILDGLKATRLIMQDHPVPVVIISATRDVSEVELAMEAFSAGAVTLLRKPINGVLLGDEIEEFVRTVKAMAFVQVVRQHKGLSENGESADVVISNSSELSIVGIAASTGGPAALMSILSSLPSTFPVPIVVVQHIMKGFTLGMMSWLDEQCQLTVKMANQGERVQQGNVYLAQEGFHLGVDEQRKLTLIDAPAIGGFKPSANSLFESLAKHYGKQALGIILTGMGSDGVEGLKLMRDAGAKIIAQDEVSCAVYGMPRMAYEAGVTNYVLSLTGIASYLQSSLRGSQL